MRGPAICYTIYGEGDGHLLLYFLSLVLYEVASLMTIFRFVMFVSGLTIGPLNVAQAEIIRVDTPAAFAEAWQSAPNGAEIVLAPGDYGRMQIRGDTRAALIRSVDPDAPARFTSADVDGIDGVTFEGLLFDYVFAPGDRIRDRIFVFRNVSNVVFRDNVFDGDHARGVSQVDDGRGFAFGLAVSEGHNVLIEGNEIFEFWKGLHVRGIDGVIVRDNELHTLRMDGMNFAQVSDVLVEDNHIHSFNRALDSADHADMIQFWTNRTDWSSHDIVIRGNILNAGTGWFTQSIFMRNERSDTTGSLNLELYYRDILIEENVIINAHTHGITVGDAIGVTVRNNTVVQNPAAAPRDPTSGRYTPSIRVAEVSLDVDIIGNITSDVIGYGGQSTWRVIGNLSVQAHSILQPGHYGQVFEGGPADQVASFRYLADGPAGPGGLGAEMLR